MTEVQIRPNPFIANGGLMDLTGIRFGLLVVQGPAPKHEGNSRRQWLCVCDCGRTKVSDTGSLRSGNVKSCGCLWGFRSRTHGLTNTPEYYSWGSMVQRCTNPNAKYWHRYGGRGITICPEWMSFENFFADMGKRPTPRHSLDRIDADGNYEPGNCRWATQKEQMNNMSRNQWKRGGICIRGHELNDENSFSRRGHRECRLCRRQLVNAKRAAMKARGEKRKA